jgi:uncharacterized protein YbcV (DUF1398 family)
MIFCWQGKRSMFESAAFHAVSTDLRPHRCRVATPFPPAAVRTPPWRIARQLQRFLLFEAGGDKQVRTVLYGLGGTGHDCRNENQDRKQRLCQSLYVTSDGPVVIVGTPLVTGISDVPAFNREALIVALRTDQAGQSTLPEFLAASWCAGVVRCDVDFPARTVTYFGSNGEEYIEDYPAVEILSSQSAEA